MMKKFRFLMCMALCMGLAALFGSQAALAQGGFVRAYVDPGLGSDLTGQVNNPALPYQTIQQAIDDCHVATVAALWVNPNTEGIVYCMPGVYGPSNNNNFPIYMRDRVHVQGQGFRRTVLRGVDANNRYVHWPDSYIDNDTAQWVEVLVDFSYENRWYSSEYYPPGIKNMEEMIDGFTFQSGDVQVFFSNEAEAMGRVSNCVFDMRHEDPEFPNGPYFGVMMVHVYDWTNKVYHNIHFNILNNTFIMGQHGAPTLVDSLCRPEAVGIIDVNDPTPSGDWDDNLVLRGVGAPSIQNNLLRTLPSQGGVKVMLGIDSTDTQTIADGPTNAFHQSRVGATNGVFYSQIDPPLTPLPFPRVDLTNTDPGFVGEFFARFLPNFRAYRDWRLMPDSPLKDMGTPANKPYIKAANQQTVYNENKRESSSFDWDGEVYGNPRSVEATDIGADEIHLMIMAGCWANESNSFYNYPGALNPSITANAPNQRLIILPSWAGGPGSSLVVNGTLVPPNFPAGVPAWFSQPGTLYPFLENLGMPVNYNRRYLTSFTNPGATPTPWIGNAAVFTRGNPVIGSQSHTFAALRVADTDFPGAADYLNTQPVVNVNGVTYWGNLQSEYR